MNYRHPEAFCLMRYECEDCHRDEMLWNGRDGVTPFAINCRFDTCGGIMQHVDWSGDRRDEDFGYQFIIGLYQTMRVFVSMTAGRAMEAATRRLIAAEGSPNPPPRRDTAERRALINTIADDFYRNGEAPDIITGAEYAAAIKATE